MVLIGFMLFYRDGPHVRKYQCSSDNSAWTRWNSEYWYGLLPSLTSLLLGSVRGATLQMLTLVNTIVEEALDDLSICLL